MNAILYDMPSELTEETYYVCTVPGCDSVVFDEEFQDLGCSYHGQTLERSIRQFENGTMVSEFLPPPNMSFSKQAVKVKGKK